MKYTQRKSKIVKNSKFSPFSSLSGYPIIYTGVDDGRQLDDSSK